MALSLAVTPALPQSPSGPELRLPEKLDRALRDMMDRMKPTLDDLLGTLEVFERIDGLEFYERPEILPNGDIIIRRRGDAPLWQPPAVPDGEEDGVKT
jgi:hypothetical protein